MKKSLLMTIVIIGILFTNVQGAVKALEVNAALVLMFHPEMRDFLPEYTSFSINSYEFDGVETERIQKRIERIESKKDDIEKRNKFNEKIQNDIAKKKEQLTQIIADKNRELFDLNAKYRKEMKNLDINEVAAKESEREKEYNKTIDKYEKRIIDLDEEIKNLNSSLNDTDSEFRAQQAVEKLNAGDVFLSEDEEIIKAERIVSTLNDAIAQIAKQKKADIVLNRSHYTPLSSLTDSLTLEKIFSEQYNISVEEIYELPLSAVDNEVQDSTIKPLHNLLDSNDELDIVKFYSMRYSQLQEIARPFYIPVIGKNILYGPEFSTGEEITIDVIKVLFEKYKVRDFEKEISLKLLDKILNN
ncbi:MAG: hypothetical protein M0R46_10225 [Candidatus Muirbacterium halophilum]|nr:hypothetical protein [Candidatus Muirbacterium halophilum]MCK9476287.1 hypothetical protein [Candidatus Muirbacterium halophilum]